MASSIGRGVTPPASTLATRGAPPNVATCLLAEAAANPVHRRRSGDQTDSAARVVVGRRDACAKAPPPGRPSSVAGCSAQTRSSDHPASRTGSPILSQPAKACAVWSDCCDPRLVVRVGPDDDPSSVGGPIMPVDREVGPVCDESHVRSVWSDRVQRGLALSRSCPVLEQRTKVIHLPFGDQEGAPPGKSLTVR